MSTVKPPEIGFIATKNIMPPPRFWIFENPFSTRFFPPVFRKSHGQISFLPARFLIAKIDEIDRNLVFPSVNRQNFRLRRPNLVLPARFFFFSGGQISFLPARFFFFEGVKSRFQKRGG